MTDKDRLLDEAKALIETWLAASPAAHHCLCRCTKCRARVWLNELEKERKRG